MNEFSQKTPFFILFLFLLLSITSQAQAQAQVTSHKSQVTSHKSQVTSHKSQDSLLKQSKDEVKKILNKVTPFLSGEEQIAVGNLESSCKGETPAEEETPASLPPCSILLKNKSAACRDDVPQKREPEDENPYFKLENTFNSILALGVLNRECRFYKHLDSHKERCDAIEKRFKKEVHFLIKNPYGNKKLEGWSWSGHSRIGLQCQTENDNSIIWPLNGTDEGDTATHSCRLSYHLKSGGALHLNFTTALFTDVLYDRGYDRDLFLRSTGSHIVLPNGTKIDENSDFRRTQKSLDRKTLDFAYEGLISKTPLSNTAVRVGGYLARHDLGPNSLGFKIQDEWHRMHGLFTYEDVTEEELARYPKYGGGIIAGLTHNYTHHDSGKHVVKSKLKLDARAGIEGGEFFGQVKGEASLSLRAYLNRNQSGSLYGEVGAGLQYEYKKYGGVSNGNLSAKASIEFGYQGKGNLEYFIYASQSMNLGENKYGTGPRNFYEGYNGLNNPATKSDNRFVVGTGARVLIQDSWAQRHRKAYIEYIEQLKQDLRELNPISHPEEYEKAKKSLENALK